ncbi:calcium/sodium antiporter [Rhodohalobacter halophilus]|uniref:calcium/sodium antiporter n=1 Tax=Rhodohalobacter halophilus TaxID=1812810 RepID=UPI00083FDA7A|nr:calcium/sodium antiporter [Rhodohalobacter halophilus]
MLSTIIWFIIGLAALIGGAELLVRASSSLAVRLGISKLIVGLTVVSFGTSAPELGVSLQAGFAGNTDLLLGNIVGSNISNTLLILGIAAIILPLKVNVKLIRVDVPVMIGITLLLFIFALSGTIYFWESLILVILLGIYLTFLIRENKHADLDDEIETLPTSTPLLITTGIIGLIMLVLGARWLVDSAVIFAEMAGISELVIGLTVVSIGTSLPEIVTAVVAALKGERDIAVGNVVGSNILNILVVLGVTGLIIPTSIPVQPSLVRFDLIILIAASFACLPIFFTRHKIDRFEGFVFLTMYIAYLLYLFLFSTDHDLLDAFSNTMIFFVLPLVAVTILSIFWREWKRRRRFYLAAKQRNEEINDE